MEVSRWNYIAACRAVIRQRPRNKQIYQSRYWKTQFVNKTRSRGKYLSNVSTATKQHTTRHELLETVVGAIHIDSSAG
jgi:hypothetical protein